jgi:hypothetical protein
MEKTKIKFYSYYDSKRTPNHTDAFNFKIKKTDIVFPCIVLVRCNNWNDYGFHSHFETFYLPDNKDIVELGAVKIIQSKAVNCDTKLPDEFDELSKKEFFSRGALSFYNKLNSFGDIKDIVLSALNDVHFNRYSKEYICEVDNDLRYPYDNSLFRDDSSELEVSSDYAKYSLDILEKITSCVASLSKLDDKEQKIIRKLLYGSVITSLETYLGDAFKYRVINNESYYSSFLMNYRFEDKKKYNLKELGLQGAKIGEFIKQKVKENLNNIIFHKVDLVKTLYREILNIDLPSTVMDFQDSIQKRHDIFHRNGKDIAGFDLNIQSSDITALIVLVKKFIIETEKIMAAQS